MADWGKIASRGTVEDRRSLAPTVAGGLSLTGVALLLVFNYLAGGDVTDVLMQLEDVALQPQYSVSDESNLAFEGEDEYEVFASTVLGSNNALWAKAFDQNGLSYDAPRLVLFRTATQSG